LGRESRRRSRAQAQLFDVSTSLVVGLNQLLELGQKVDAGPVQSHKFVELCANGNLELFKLDILRGRFCKSFCQSFKVDFGKIDSGRLLTGWSVANVKSIGGDGVIEQAIYVGANSRYIPGSSCAGPSANFIGDGAQARDGGDELDNRWVWLDRPEDRSNNLLVSEKFSPYRIWRDLRH
jgi:hypothetical protein